jgi:hypothetical protein
VNITNTHRAGRAQQFVVALHVFGEVLKALTAVVCFRSI